MIIAQLGLILAGTFIAQEATTNEITPSAPITDYQLVWHDEFDGDSLDETKWNHSRLGPRRDAINVKDSATLDGEGHLLITTSRHETSEGGIEYHTAMLDTHEKYDTTFGYFECCMKLQREVGHWSAFWIHTPTIGNPLGDPAAAGTEIDVIEYLRNGDNKTIAHHNLHWDGYSEHHKSKGTKVRIESLDDGAFHTFGLLWTADEYVFYVDGKETWRTTTAVSHRDEYMLLSLEVGNWAGDIADANLPDSLTVDYVRVFKAQ